MIITLTLLFIAIMLFTKYMEQAKFNFGQGLYTAADTAIILNLKYSQVSYWFRKYVKNVFESQSNYRYYYETDNIVAVNFYTLIEIYVFNYLRNLSIKTKKIVQAHSELSSHLNTPYPFCHSDILLASGKDIIYKLGDILAVSDSGFQQAISEYVMPYAQKIEFKDELANKFYPLGKSHSVVINPANQFGFPVIEGTNIKVSTISNLFRGGEKIEFISSLYNLTQQQVRDAINFDKAA